MNESKKKQQTLLFLLRVSLPSPPSQGFQHRDHQSTLLKGLRALGWRQRYDHSPEYTIELFQGSLVLTVRQLRMGELTGLGTGANVW